MVRSRVVPGLCVLVLGLIGSLQPNVLLGSSGQNPKAAVTGRGAAVPIPSSPTASVLYDQTDNDSGVGIVSQDFEATFDGYDSEGADDFVVPPDTTWAVTSVTTPGVYFNGAGPAEAVNLTIFNDDGGLPGAVACSYPLQTPVDTTGSFVFTLPTPCILGPGTYWLDVQARMDFGSGGEWAWETRGVQGNSPALWRNPGDGFGTGCTSFSPMAPCNAIMAPDFLFSLSGSVILFSPTALAVDPPGGDTANGVLEIGETVSVVPSWSNDTPGAFQLQGTVTEFSGPAGPVYVIDDAAADYGTIAGGATADCASATADCYSIHITGDRPAQHFDAQLTEQPSPSLPTPGLQAPSNAPTPKVWTLHVGGSFGDVPASYQFYRYVETIYHKGVTGGCGAGADYCPDSDVTRAQMAVFLLKSKYGSDYAPPDCTGMVFTDVPCTGGPFDPWIEDLANKSITGGCGGGLYCPANLVTRAQMAVFLLKTEHGPAYKLPGCTGTVFLDVPCTGGIYDAWIEALANEGITGGCGGGNYCPDNPNTRGQMAVFLTKTFDLLLYGP